MADKGVKLGPTAIRQIGEAIRKVDALPMDRLRDALVGDTFTPSPEVYFALTPADGIAARISGGALGKAECRLYRGSLVDEMDGKTGSRQLQPIEEAGVSVSKMVHNVTYAPIRGNRYVPVWREKGGTWFTVDPLVVVGFVLQQDVGSVDGFPAPAYLLDEQGNATATLVNVQSDPVMFGVYGPAAAGFRGWALPVTDSTTGETRYAIINMQRFAEYIRFLAVFGGSCEAEATVQQYWHGENPVQGSWQVRVELTWADCSCLQTEIGIAVLDEIQSTYPYLKYNVVAYDQVLNVADVDECDEGGYACIGEPVRTLLFGKGLYLSEGSCSESSCTYVVQTDGLEVVGVDCDGEETQKLGVRTLKIEAPLSTSMGDESECLGTATISLPTGLVESDCLDVEYNAEACKYQVQMPDNLVQAGAGIAVAANGCGYVVSATGVDTGIAEGDCIAFDVDGDTVTVNNTMEVVGGNGITVQASGCTRVVSFNAANSAPQANVNFLCDVEISQTPISITCVSDGQGGYTFSVTGGEITLNKKFSTLTLPAVLITDLSSDCGGSGSGSSGSGDPDTVPDPPYTGDYFQIEWIDCDGTNPESLSAPLPEGLFLLHTVPEGATHFTARTVNLRTSTHMAGDTSYLGVPEPWHILLPADVETGDTVRITVTFYGPNGVVATQSEDATCQ
jgi:hypothetical protein